MAYVFSELQSFGFVPASDPNNPNTFIWNLIDNAKNAYIETRPVNFDAPPCTPPMTRIVFDRPFGRVWQKDLAVRTIERALQTGQTVVVAPPGSNPSHGREIVITRMCDPFVQNVLKTMNQQKPGFYSGTWWWFLQPRGWNMPI